MEDAPLDDALARLEASPEDAANPRLLASQPSTLPAAVEEWVRVRGWKRGAHVVPPAAVLLSDFVRHCEAHGWDYRTSARVLGETLGKLFRRVHRRGRRGYLMREEDATGLWLLAEEVAPQLVAKRPARRPRLRRGVESTPRERRPPFHPVVRHAIPVISSAGEVFPSPRVAAELLRAHVRSIQQANREGQRVAAGRLWRQLTREEVALVPPDARAGDVVLALAWRGTVSVQCCPRCGYRPHGPPPPGFLPPPGHSEAGGPTRTFSSNSEPHIDAHEDTIHGADDGAGA